MLSLLSCLCRLGCCRDLLKTFSDFKGLHELTWLSRSQYWVLSKKFINESGSGSLVPLKVSIHLSNMFFLSF